jgi:hypothetical protein
VFTFHIYDSGTSTTYVISPYIKQLLKYSKSAFFKSKVTQSVREMVYVFNCMDRDSNVGIYR